MIEWISVKKKKPRLGQEVLVHYKFYEGNEGYRVVSCLKCYSDRRKHIFADPYPGLKGYGQSGWPVTHWSEINKP